MRFPVYIGGWLLGAFTTFLFISGILKEAESLVLGGCAFFVLSVVAGIIAVTVDHDERT